MALEKVTYVDGVTIIGAKNLNDIQDEMIRQGEQQTEDEESMEAALALKADKETTYTKTEVNTALALKADKSDTFTKAEVNSALALKADKSDTYTKTEVNEALELKADKSDTYTKAVVDGMVQDAIAEAVKESEYSNFEMKSVSGDFVHITDGAGLIPVKDLKIGIDAVQISGWTGARVTVAGKNLFSNVFSDYMKPVDYYICPIKLEKNTYYSISATKKSTVTGCVIGLAKKGTKYTEFGDFDTIVNSSGGVSSYIPKSFYVNDSFESPKLIVFCSGETQFNQLLDAYDIQLEQGNTVTAFEPYKGKTYSITWQTEAGTVYGGTLDVTIGELMVTHAEVDLGTLNWENVSGYQNIFMTYIDGMKPADNSTISNSFGTPYIHVDGRAIANTDKAITVGMNGVNQVMVHDSTYADATTFKTAMSGVYLVYELATPQTYQLIPTEVLTLLGENNIFADTGAIEELIYRISRQ